LCLNCARRKLTLTTAAGLWVSAAIGMAVGYKLYFIALFTTFLAIAVLILLWFVEHRFIKKLVKIPREEQDDDEIQA